MLAHSRRQRENDTFTGIAEALPIQENTKDLDKASVLRVAIHFLKLRDVVAEGDGQDQAEEEESKKLEAVYITASLERILHELPLKLKDLLVHVYSIRQPLQIL